MILCTCSAGRNEGLQLKKTAQNEVVSLEYEIIAPDKKPPDDILNVYTELELIEQLELSSGIIYANAQPTGEEV